MNYHHRYQEDGSCEVICTHCFQTIGTVSRRSAIKDLEATHFCAGRASQNGHYKAPFQDLIPSPPAKHLGWIPDYSRKIVGLPIPLLLLGVVLFLYALPTALEIALSAQIGPWLAGIVIGDFAACACIFAVFGMRRTGLILYLLLTISKICLYSVQVVPANIIPWLTDVIPVLIVIGRIATLKLRPAAEAVRPQ